MTIEFLDSPTTYKRARSSINANFTALFNAVAGPGAIDATDPAVTALLTDTGSGAYAAVEGVVEDVADGVVEGLVTGSSATRSALDAVYQQAGEQVQQVSPTDKRAYRVVSPTWSSERAYGDGNKDGLFYVSNFVDNSGIETTGGVYQSYTKVFGVHATKNGHGNFDAFWASVHHNGPDEVGLFIGDAKTHAGGNVWGAHFEVHADTVEANMYGQRVEVYNKVAGTSKVKVGTLIRSLGDYEGTVGLQISGTAGWTNYLVIRDTSDTAIFSIRGSDGQVTTQAILAAGNIASTGNVTAAGMIRGASNADGAQIVRLQSERPWAFRQVGTGGSTALRLSPDATDKIFDVASPNGTAPLSVFVSDTAASNSLRLGNSGGKVGFFGTTPIAKPTGVSTDAASIHAALVSLGLIGA